MTFEEKKALLQKACEQKPLAHNTEYPLHLYDWSFKEVETRGELLEHLNEDYAIRNGFIYKNLAMVQQSNGGDEWLTFCLNETINEYQSIDSISFAHMQKKYSAEHMKIYLCKLAYPANDNVKEQVLTAEHCDTSREIDYTDKLLVLKTNALAADYQNAESQIFYAIGGFGCSPTTAGRAVHGYFPTDKEAVYWRREDFIGVLKEEYTPQWVQEVAIEFLGTAPDLQTEQQEKFSAPSQEVQRQFFEKIEQEFSEYHKYVSTLPQEEQQKSLMQLGIMCDLKQALFTKETDNAWNFSSSFIEFDKPLQSLYKEWFSRCIDGYYDLVDETFFAVQATIGCCAEKHNTSSMVIDREQETTPNLQTEHEEESQEQQPELQM